MSLKIRMKRMGNRNRPFYRLVVQDSRWPRDGKSIEDLGWYDPVKQPAEKSFKEESIYHWLEQGARMSETARSLLKREGILGKFKSGEYKNDTDEPAEEPVTAAPVSVDAPETAPSNEPESAPTEELEATVPEPSNSDG